MNIRIEVEVDAQKQVSKLYLARSLSDAPVRLGSKEAKTTATTPLRRKAVVLMNNCTRDVGWEATRGKEPMLHYLQCYLIQRLRHWKDQMWGIWDIPKPGLSLHTAQR